MKKRFLAMTLAGMMSVGMLAGCGGTSSGSGTADEAYNIRVIVKLTDGHFNKVMAGAKAYADEHPNVTVDIMSPTSAVSYDEQLNMIQTSLSSPVYDAVVISPLQSTTAGTLVANTDKTIIALDTDFTSDKKSAFVGTGNEDAAKSGGTAAAEEAKKRGIEKPTAVIVTGVQGDETHDARMNGYTKGFEEAGGEIIEVQYCEGLADRAANAMESVIQKNPNGVDVILSTNDDMALAVAKVIKDSGGAAYQDTIICGFDGNQSAIEAIQNGQIAMDIAQLGYDMGYKAVEAAVDRLEGKEVASFIDSGAKVIDSSNAEEYIADMKSKGLWE